MEKAKDYVVASGTSTQVLKESVKRFLSEGWQPIGGVETTTFTTVQSDGKKDQVIYFYQAMVKYED